MEWYDYISNRYLFDTIGMLWTDYSLIIGFGASCIGMVVKMTRTKKDDEVWAFVKAKALAAIGKGK